MKVVTFANQKGGSGKSTLTLLAATSLANDCGCRVLVIDADPQQSLLNLRVQLDEPIREENEAYRYPIVSKQLADIVDFLDEEEDNYDVCFIDLPGRSDSPEARRVIGLCDMVIVPYAATDFHRLSTEDFLQGMRAIRADLPPEAVFVCYTMQTSFSPSRRGDAELTSYLDTLDFPRLQSVISHRACYMSPSTLHSFLAPAYRRAMGVPAAVAKEITGFTNELVLKLALTPQTTTA